MAEDDSSYGGRVVGTMVGVNNGNSFTYPRGMLGTTWYDNQRPAAYCQLPPVRHVCLQENPAQDIPRCTAQQEVCHPSLDSLGEDSVDIFDKPEPKSKDNEKSKKKKVNTPKSVLKEIHEENSENPKKKDEKKTKDAEKDQSAKKKDADKKKLTEKEQPAKKKDENKKEPTEKDQSAKKKDEEQKEPTEKEQPAKKKEADQKKPTEKEQPAKKKNEDKKEKGKEVKGVSEKASKDDKKVAQQEDLKEGEKIAVSYALDDSTDEGTDRNEKKAKDGTNAEDKDKKNESANAVTTGHNDDTVQDDSDEDDDVGKPLSNAAKPRQHAPSKRNRFTEFFKKIFPSNPKKRSTIEAENATNNASSADCDDDDESSTCSKHFHRNYQLVSMDDSMTSSSEEEFPTRYYGNYQALPTDDLTSSSEEGMSSAMALINRSSKNTSGRVVINRRKP